MDMPNDSMPAGGAMGAGMPPETNDVPTITCPSCGTQMALTATPMEAPQEPDGDEGGAQMPPGQPPMQDDYDQQAQALEAKRGKQFKNRAGVAQALREYNQ